MNERVNPFGQKKSNPYALEHPERSRDLSSNLGTISKDIFLISPELRGHRNLEDWISDRYFPPSPLKRDLTSERLDDLGHDQVGKYRSEMPLANVLREDTSEELGELLWIVRWKVLELSYCMMTHFQEAPSIRFLRLSPDNRIKQRRAWLLLGWLTAERSCPCKQSACPAINGGSEVTLKPLVSRLSVREGFLALTSPGKIRLLYFTLVLLRTKTCPWHLRRSPWQNNNKSTGKFPTLTVVLKATLNCPQLLQYHYSMSPNCTNNIGGLEICRYTFFLLST
ncbi:hypothetical protein J6590_018596 [Homalodisca vitripennis]|nr:hypothetical protein J6590_018596 [Homalodisca vitripennis]